MANNLIRLIKTKFSDDHSAAKHLLLSIDGMVNFEASSFIEKDKNCVHVCVSTMAGCTMKCRICSTAYCKPYFERVLSDTEIVESIQVVLRQRPEIDTLKSEILIGFMGNGEPLANFDNVAIAIEKILGDANLNIDAIFLSTVGVNIHYLPKLAEIGNRTGKIIGVQYSLISMDKEIRQNILPNAPPLSEVLPYLDNYSNLTGRRIKYNFPLIKNINDSIGAIDAVRRFIIEKPKTRLLKISTFNNFPGAPYEGCSVKEIQHVVYMLVEANTPAESFIGYNDESLGVSCGQMRLEMLKS